MPTAAKLIAALGFAFVAAATSILVVLMLLGKGALWGYFIPINVGLGLIFGWTTIGGRVGERIGISIGAGLLAAAYLLVLVILLQAFWEVIQRGMNLRYSGLEEAFEGFFNIARGYLTSVATPEIMGTLFGGGAVTAIVSHAISKVWK